MEYETLYADLIIKRQLQLKQGEALSINTESSTIDFARLLARLATLVTVEAVQIVETEKGRIKQVYPIEPEVNEAIRPNINGLVMCHIVNLDEAPYHSEEEPEELAKDIVQLGRYGLLAEPVELDRRIACPWANIPYPGAAWGMQHLSPEATEKEMWDLFASLLRLDDGENSSYWAEQANMLSFRKKRLDAHKKDNLLLRGDGWALTLNIAGPTSWAGGEQATPSGRKFFSNLPVQNLYATIDAKSANGSFCSSRPFLLLGKMVENATFTIKDGKCISWEAESGMKALDAYFSVDEGARTLTELSIADENTRESRMLQRGSHPLFDKAMTTHIGFGGFNVETLHQQLAEEELESNHLSQSLVHLDVPVGSSTLEIIARDGEGNETVLMDEGVFCDA